MRECLLDKGSNLTFKVLPSSQKGLGVSDCVTDRVHSRVLYRQYTYLLN